MAKNFVEISFSWEEKAFSSLVDTLVEELGEIPRYPQGHELEGQPLVTKKQFLENYIFEHLQTLESTSIMKQRRRALRKVERSELTKQERAK